MYIDLVLVKHDGCNQPYLFQAPAWSYLKEGDRVVVHNKFDEQTATVIEAITTTLDSETYRMVVKSSRAKEPLAKVVAKLDYSKFTYEEAKADEQSDSN